MTASSEFFDHLEIATMVGLIANLEPDPDSDDPADRLIRRCQTIVTKVQEGEQR